MAGLPRHDDTFRWRKLTLVCAYSESHRARRPGGLLCGAIAELYRELSGGWLYGKPHWPIYDQAIAPAKAKRVIDAPLSRVSAIGDSVRN